MKVLLPVDGSDFTKRMLAYIAAHDELLGAGHDYTIFTAIPLVPSRAARFLDSSIVNDHYRDLAEEVFHPVRKFAEQQGWKTHEVHVAGHAAEAIAELAESGKFDLIVMGTHGHSALGNMVLGSVASGVLARCKVPVLLIR